MARNDYRINLKKKTKEQLVKWLDSHYDLLLSVGHDGGSTPLLTKIIYAEKLLNERK